MRTLSLFIFLLALFGSFSLSFAQDYTISGFIRAEQDQEDLIGATVFSPALNKGTTTDATGFYSIQLPEGNYVLEFSYLGFEPKARSVALSADQKLSVSLAAESTALAEVVVTSTAKDANVQEAALGVEKLSADVVKQLPTILGEADIVKAIQLLPGVSSVGEGSSGFNVRGGSSDQNLVLLDGATLYNPSHLLGFFSVFNADAIKDVQLYKGSIPARYGGRLSSVLDVTQRDGNKKEFAGTASLGLISSRLALEGPIAKGDKAEGNGSWLITGRRSYADLFLRLTEDFSDNVLYFYDLNARVNYRLGEKDRIFLSGYLGQDRFALPDLFGTNWGNSAATLRWNHLFNDKLSSDLTAIYSGYTYGLENLAPGAQSVWNSSIDNYTLQQDFNWFVNDNNNVKFGAQAIYYDFNPGEIEPIGDDSPISPITYDPKYGLEFGVYMSNEQTISEQLTLNYGLRFSGFNRIGSETIRTYANDEPVVREPGTGTYLEGEVIGERTYGRGESISFFTGWEPRVSLRYTIDEQSSIKAGYNRMYQYLHLISNTTSATPLDIWSPSGPFKGPQRSDQIGVGYFRNFQNNTYEFSAEVYYKWLDNLVDFVDGADLTFNNYLETELLTGTGRAYGLELQISKVKGDFTGWLSYTLSRTERLVDGINNGEYYASNFDKPHDFSITGMYKYSDRWTFAANLVYATGQPVTYPSGRYDYSGLTVADYGSRNQDRLPDYHRLDLSATLKSKPRPRMQGQWIFSVYNAYNRRNANSIFFQERNTDGSGQEVATGVTEAVRLSFFGIVPSVAYEIKF
ncbi:MAG: TonB-dependent receptor [Phaeodactylibacter sp.]|nr:TonB-dependent receptor [Phaeodactylibacter sp.]